MAKLTAIAKWGAGYVLLPSGSVHLEKDLIFTNDGRVRVVLSPPVSDDEAMEVLLKATWYADQKEHDYIVPD